ncbi:MAG: dihydroorotate dehydrogenase electron transfer subunit [Bacteroidales bacterium]|nr:dihydroorotate dehydrogenase electron transfer subunit [Bacteroidales bacterium]
MRYCKDFIVVENETITSTLFILKLQYPETLPEIKAGQFVEILVQGNKDVFLRRPISIHDVDIEKNQISLLVQIVGKGTDQLSNLKIGDTLNLIFPLGNGFTIVGKRVLLIGGGCGAAPLLYLARVLKQKQIKSEILIGCKDANHLFSKKEYESLSNLHIATEDGSCGLKGLVTSHKIVEEDFDAIYCCGPTPMMKAISKHAKERNIPCYVSLEHKMACGFGVCLCCVVETNIGNKRTCVTGPIFLSSDLKDF